jgi:hypothetical protein
VTGGVFGPFSVLPSQISALGKNFTPFVNELLRVESAAAALDGGQLTTTYLDNVGDGGIDAGLRRAVATKWIPEGDSVWQFKAGDLAPAKCRKELRDASEALSIVRAGGVYRLVLGADLTPDKVRRRREALEKEADEGLGIEIRPGMFEVLNASDLAAWAGQYLTLAVSPLLQGIGNVARAFGEWAASNRLGGAWVDAPSRQRHIQRIREFITAGTTDLRVEGVSGTGKTRLVLEAFRGHESEPLVAYIYAADAATTPLIHHLRVQGRHAILVVDKCDPQAHESLASQLPAGSPVKLVTIGEPTGYQTQADVCIVEGLEGDALRHIIRENQPALWQEHEHFVEAASAGNIRLALLLTEAIVRQPTTITANALLSRDSIRSYVTHELPDGEGFLACCVLALFPDIRYDGPSPTELDVLADTSGLAVLTLRAAARSLTEAGLLSRQGPYRNVSPHPLAIYLAAGAWEEFHDQILDRLVPAADVFIAERLFRRAADIGDHPVIRDAVERLLAPGGLYHAIDVWGHGSESMTYLHFATIAPEAACRHAESLLAALTDRELRAHSHYRQVLVWTLGRLAWRPATFRRAATMLLRLAITSTGHDRDADPAVRSWTDLFGTFLPATAVPPDERARYLRVVASSSDRDERLLAAAAAGRALAIHEMAVIAPEVQGGVLVERRGRPATWAEAFTYMEGAIDILAELAHGNDSEIADTATSRLVGAIHPFLQVERLRLHLAKAIAGLPEPGLTAARTTIIHLEGLFERGGTAPGGDREASRQALESFTAELPAPTSEQTLAALAGTPRWDLRDGQLQDRLNDAISAMPAQDRVTHLLALLERKPEAAYEIGRAIAGLAPDDDEARSRLLGLAARGAQEALVGYLHALVQAGADDAFDQLLDSDASANLSDLAQLRLSASGPPTTAGWSRVTRLVTRLAPEDGVRGLFGWHTHLSPEQLTVFLAYWLPRIQTQESYEAVVDFVDLAAHNHPAWADSVDPLIADLVARRSRHIAHGSAMQKEWAWGQLARRQITERPTELLQTLMTLISDGSYSPDAALGETDLLRETVTATGAEGWQAMMTATESGSWQVRRAAGRWLGGTVDLGTVSEWVAASTERARLVASVTDPDGGDHIDPVARFLITTFGRDEQVPVLLRSALILKMSWNPGSGSFQQLIEQVTGWATADDQPDEVVAWTQAAVTWLRTQQTVAAQDDEETS